MKIRPLKLIRLIPAIIWGTLLHAHAQGPPQGPPPSPVVRALDKDRDQELSSREIRNATKSLLKLDQNKDGTLSKDELKPKPPRGERRGRKGEDEERPPRPPKSPLISAIDTDESGDLSKDEILAAPESLASLDRDEDGELSSNEAGIRKPEGDNGQGGGRPGPPPRR